MRILGLVTNYRRAAFVIALLVCRAESLLATKKGGSVAETSSLLQRSISADSARSAYAVGNAADRFSNFLEKTAEPNAAVSDAVIRTRFEQLIERAASQEERQALEDALEIKQESMLEKLNAKGEMVSLVSTLKRALGYRSSTTSCRQLVCGGYAFCQEADEGNSQQDATCRCQDGFEGDGFVCNPPSKFIEYPLLEADETSPPKVMDLHAATLSGNKVAVTFRDMARGNRGFLLIGKAENGGIRWGRPFLISESLQVFSPCLVELMDSKGGLAIAFRTANRGGDGILLVARQSGDSISFSSPRAFARYQAQAMALVAVPQSRVAILFAEHSPTEGSASKTFDMFGSSVLAQLTVGESSSLQPPVPEIIGKYRFAEGAVSRIVAAPLSPTLFAVAFRQAEPGDDGTGVVSREASVALAQLWGSELVFTTRSLSLEPSQTQIWSRTVSGLGNNVFAYTYHSGAEQATKQVILKFNEQKNLLDVIDGPQVIAKGFTPFVNSVSTVVQRQDLQIPAHVSLLQSQGHRVFNFIGTAGAKGHGQLCAVSDRGLPTSCKDLGTTAREVVSQTITPMADGRLLLVTTDARGSPFYSLVGIMGGL